MSDALNRSIIAQARRILAMERALVIVTAVLTMITLGASLYFEKTYGVKPYSFAIGIVAFLVSFGSFWLLFSIFKGEFQQRAPGRKKARIALWIASVYIAVASTVAYLVAFGLMGLNMPWVGAGRETLSICYFMLAVSVIFMSRSAAFYLKLRSYVMRSLNTLAR